MKESDKGSRVFHVSLRSSGTYSEERVSDHFRRTGSLQGVVRPDPGSSLVPRPRNTDRTNEKEGTRSEGLMSYHYSPNSVFGPILRTDPMEDRPVGSTRSPCGRKCPQHPHLLYPTVVVVVGPGLKTHDDGWDGTGERVRVLTRRPKT